MNVYELNLRCPDIHTQQDGLNIEHALGKSPGLSHVNVDWRRKSVHLVTGNQDAGNDAVRCLMDAGFPPEAMD